MKSGDGHITYDIPLILHTDNKIKMSIRSLKTRWAREKLGIENKLEIIQHGAVRSSFELLCCLVILVAASLFDLPLFRGGRRFHLLKFFVIVIFLGRWGLNAMRWARQAWQQLLKLELTSPNSNAVSPFCCFASPSSSEFCCSSS